MERIKYKKKDTFLKLENISLRFKGAQESIERSKVSDVINFIIDVEKKFNDNPRPFKRYNIAKSDRSNKYFRYLLDIMKYAEKLREENNSDLPLNLIITDYITSIYAFYHKYNHLPYLNQLMVNTTTKIRFDEWIDRWEKDRQEKYWKIKAVIPDIRTEAKAIIQRQELKKQIEEIDIDFLEV